jgi:hypothetical protein
VEQHFKFVTKLGAALINDESLCGHPIATTSQTIVLNFKGITAETTTQNVAKV